MADVQLENGYTRIANDIFDEIVKQKLNGTQFRIVMVLWRNTYGFQRKHHALSLTFISEATDIDKSRIKKDLKKLIDQNIITVIQEANFNQSRVIAFNKNYHEWGQEESQGAKTTPPTGGESDPSTGGENNPTTGGESAPQERKSKERYKESTTDTDTTANPFRFFQKNGFGHLSGFHAEEINHWIDGEYFDEPELVVIEAMKEALRANVRNLNYISRVLISWSKSGLKTLEDVRAHVRNRANVIEFGGRDNARSRSNDAGTQRKSKSITGGQIGWIKPQKRAGL